MENLKSSWNTDTKDADVSNNGTFTCYTLTP